ncbi:unnamed protein product [Moneuplotes crassus]|uniref:ABC transporter domain-containing protein n=1 Tax=Euplotes crassus TaxID=5936 RepID=A0AAD1U2X6_EUPCR|nr:unnamed protein product [Moneuplotes crassus]
MYKTRQERTPFLENQKELSLPLKISWKDLKYTVRTKLTKVQREVQGDGNKIISKEILKPQSGYIQAGEACFIMGSSGAGKTTLLNALCDRLTNNKKNKIEGQITLNHSHPVTQKDFGKYGAYVMQDDVLFPTLSCKEVITFSARLKLDITGDELDYKVEEIIEDLGLTKCKDTLIGDHMMKGLSGGERKRTAIAVEMVTNPKVLFLDEPTSGLDSFTANKIVKILVNQARLGKTVLATIHQPSSGTFALFDKLILLMDGYQIYHGSAKDSVNYFTDLGFSIPTYANPADYYLMEFFVPFKKSQEDKDKMDLLINKYQEILAPRVEEEDTPSTKYPQITYEDLSQSFKHASFIPELREVVKRAVINIRRHPMLVKMRVGQTLMISLMCCLCFWNLGFTVKSMQNKAGFIYFLSVNQFMSGMFTVLITFLNERSVFLREYASKTYGLPSYFISKSVVDTPFQFIFPIITALIIYFAAGFEVDAARFFIFTVVLVGMIFCGTSWGFLIGCAFQNIDKALNSAFLCVMPVLMFGGFYVNLKTVYVWLRWISWISPVRYSTEALLRNEIENNDSYPDLPTPIYEAFDYNLGMNWSIAMLFILGVVLRALAYFALKLTIAKVE